MAGFRAFIFTEGVVKTLGVKSTSVRTTQAPANLSEAAQFLKKMYGTFKIAHRS